MPCRHILRPACGCQQEAVAEEPTLVQEQPEVEVFSARRGRKPSPWKVRAQEEQAQRAREEAVTLEWVQEQVEEAVQRGEAERVLDQLEAALAIYSFSTFCRLAWHVVDKTTRLEWGKAHELVCTTLQAIFEDWLLTKTDEDHIPTVRNCAINIAPGMLKSRIIAVFFMAWCWLRCPGMRFICLSVNGTAAVRDALAARDVIRSQWYQDSFQPQWQLRGDHDAVTDYSNTEGGGRLSQASGSEVVGLRGDCLLIDDANNPNDSGNETERTIVNDLFDNNQFSRVNDLAKSLRLGVQQRTHQDDWTGHAISRLGLWSEKNRSGWLNVVLPIERELSRAPFRLPEPLLKLVQDLPGIVTEDWRTKEGESLHPRFSPDVIDGLKRQWAGTGNYAAQGQQRPSSEAGDKFKRVYFGWFRLAGGVKELHDELGTRAPRPDGCRQEGFEVVPVAQHRPNQWDFDKLVISVDAAVKKTEAGSLWGMLCIGYRGARRYVLDDRSRRGHPDEVNEVLRDMIRYWHPDEILVEDKGGGSGILRTLEVEVGRGDLPMVLITGFNPGTEDKVMRANAALPTVANGFVYLLDGAPWVNEFVDELAGFPNYTTNDRVDALTQCINASKDSEGSGLPGEGGWAAAGL